MGFTYQEQQSYGSNPKIMGFTYQELQSYGSNPNNMGFSYQEQQSYGSNPNDMGFTYQEQQSYGSDPNNMGFTYQEQQSYGMIHGQSYSENEYFSHGSGMHVQVLPTPFSPHNKPPNHQTMFIGGHKYLHQDGWQQGPNTHHEGWYQGHKMHQNGWHGSGANFSHASGGIGKQKPHYGTMNDTQTQFAYDLMVVGSGRANHFHQVHVPAQAVTVQEMCYEHSSWQSGGSGRSHLQNFNDNFMWFPSGCNGGKCVCKSV